ncbi:MAG TPA: hypothetical protein PK450_11465 [Paracoccaceae bacterium]|nr:hypothetical protein [Paracoccaceae bacterium]
MKVRRAAKDGARGRAHGPRHLRIWATLGLSIMAVILVLAVLGLSGRSIPLPGMAVSFVEGRANLLLDGQARLRIGGGDLVVSSAFVPQIRLSDVTLMSARGQRFVQIADLRTSLDTEALWRGRVVPAQLRATGARIAVRRQEDGSLDIAPGAPGFTGAAFNPAEILDAVDAAFDQPGLAPLREITVEGLEMLFDDRRAGQVWTIRDGALELQQGQSGLEAELRFALEGQAAAALGVPVSEEAGPVGGRGVARATALLTLTTDRKSSQAALTADLEGVSARDLAAQVPPLAWLGALDAPISGQVQTGFEATGALSPLEVRLSVGAGALQPTPDTRPVPFNSAELQARFDPARASLFLTSLRIDSAALRAELSGKAWLKGLKAGRPEALVAQLHLSDLSADPEGLFADAVSIGQGAADMKLTLDPFRLTLGQVTLTDRGRKITAKGEVAAAEDGWSVALDVGVDTIEMERLLALWPLGAVPKTREWLQQNVATGELFDVRGALRLKPGAEPRFSLAYRFRGAEVRFMRLLPPINSGLGYATINDNAFVLVAESGHVVAPKGGNLDIAGSVLKVPDIRQKPAPMEVTLKSDSTITAALSILDEPPFEFLRKAGQAVDIAEGRAHLTTLLRLIPKAKMNPKDVTYDVTGTLTEVSSDRLVKGRKLSADALAVKVTNKGIEISGDAALDGVPLSGAWRQAFGTAGAGRSSVAGQIELSLPTLEEFAITLPKGAVGGTGVGDFTLDLQKGQPPTFRMTSDLRGLVLAIPELGWKKAADSKGSLEIVGRFGAPAHVDSLILEAERLRAEGSISLKEDNGLDLAEFGTVTFQDWFKGGVAIRGQGKGKPVAIALTGGSVDLRQATFGSGEAGDGSASPILDVTLDRLRISDGIALDGFKGRFASDNGLNGSFTGNVNGRAPLTGETLPDTNGRAAFRLRAEDAGAVLAAAGLYGSGRGGQMNLLLRPLEAKGIYDGAIDISGIRVVDAPGLAGLLNAISVVGLINELQGTGIVFSDVTGRFLLTPEAVEIREGSAIGASLGVSAAGVYWSGEQRFDLQGVISPLYLLNGVGQIFSRQRDGLFGFNYTLTGTTKKYSVAVNPVSILTPGMFRDLFRKAPPRIEPVPQN